MKTQQTVTQTVSIEEIEKIVTEFENLKGAKFVSIRMYETKEGSVYNYVLNMNINTLNAKTKDVETFKNVSEKQIIEFAEKLALNIKEAKIGFEQLLKSKIQNLSPNVSDRTDASQRQTNMYKHIGKGIKYHLTNETYHFYGQIITCETIKKVEKKQKNYRTDVTKFKDLFPKTLNLRMNKYINLRIDRVKEIRLQGNTLIFE